MKLGEALRLRSDNMKRLAHLGERAKANAKAQEGTDPAEAPAALLLEIEGLSAQTLSLVQRINRTNNATMVPSGEMLSDVLAERDSALRLRLPYVGIADAVSEAQMRSLRTEIRMVRMVDPIALRKRADELSKRHRELDAMIQELNWTTELSD